MGQNLIKLSIYLQLRLLSRRRFEPFDSGRFRQRDKQFYSRAESLQGQKRSHGGVQRALKRQERSLELLVGTMRQNNIQRSQIWIVQETEREKTGFQRLQDSKTEGRKGGATPEI